MNAIQVLDIARKNIYDRSFFENGWLWRQLAIHELIDYRNEYSFVRRMQCEVFELGLIPMSMEEYFICQNISKFIHGESDCISMDDFQHLLCRFKNFPERVKQFKNQHKRVCWQAKVELS